MRTTRRILAAGLALALVWALLPNVAEARCRTRCHRAAGWHGCSAAYSGCHGYRHAVRYRGCCSPRYTSGCNPCYNACGGQGTYGGGCCQPSDGGGDAGSVSPAPAPAPVAEPPAPPPAPAPTT